MQAHAAFDMAWVDRPPTNHVAPASTSVVLICLPYHPLLTLGVRLLSGPVGWLRDAEDALAEAALLLPARGVCRRNTTVLSERGPSRIGGNAPSGVQPQHGCAQHGCAILCRLDAAMALQ